MTEPKIAIPARRSALRGASFALFITALCAVLAGCANNSPSSDNTGSFSSSTMSPTDVVATVNGDPITAQQYLDGLQHYVPSTLGGFPNNVQLTQQAGFVILQNLILSDLKLQLAKAADVPVQPSDLDASLNDYKLIQQSQSVLPPDQLLQQQGYTEDQFKQEVLAPQVAEINFLQKSIVISSAALQQVYKAQMQLYRVPAALHIHRIACATKNQALGVITGLKSGVPIQNFVMDNVAGDDAGGDPNDPTNIANWIHIDHVNPALGTLGTELVNAKVGDVIGPAQVGGQWWVIQVAEKRAASIIPFDQAQDIVRIYYVRQMAGEQGKIQLQMALYQMMRQSEIHINIPAYSYMSQQMHDLMLPSQGPAPSTTGKGAGKPSS